ncbi:MAG: SWIM zinc finger family protein [Janthinobacterium lividum]
MFTREYLQALATATIFGRGKEYFRAGSVGKITREGDKFTAKVRGTHPYKVQLTLKAGGAKLKCNCPYDFEGICKHAVALGLAILEEFGPRLAVSKATASTPVFSTAALEAALRDTAAPVQLAFLAEILRRDNTLGQQFLTHIGPSAPASPPSTPAAVTIDSISTEVYEALSDLAFDDELLSEYDKEYTNYRYDEDDTLLEAADEAIDEVLTPHADAVAEALHDGHLTEALRRWVGVYEGSTAATAPQADDYDLFGYEGYPAHVQARWQELLAGQEIPQLLENKSFAAAETEAALSLLTERYRGPASRATVLAGQEVTPMGSAPLLKLPPHFYDLLHALAHDPATAAQLRPLLAEVPMPDVGLARVLLRVAEVLADDPLWLRTSETFAAQDATLTVQLLDRYRERGDRASLRRVLHQQRAQFPQLLNAYILSHLTPDEDEPLYLAALEQRCRQTQSLADYRTLQAYWSPAQRRNFVDEQTAQGIRTGNDPLFGAELLTAANRETELLPYLLRTNWTWQRSIPEILTLAARTHPDDCLDAVMEHTETLLQDPINGRGRGRYQRIAAWLAALHTVEELRPPVALFAAHLYTEYMRLNALREELRAARLVRTQLVGKQHRLIVSEAEDEEVRELLRDQQGKPGRKPKKQA